MSITEKLNKIKSCKEDIKQAIIDKGVDMTGVSLEGYATKISEIQTGGGSGDYLDIKANLTTYYSTVESVGDYAFAYCGSLTSVDLPMCSSVGGYAFDTCSSLQSVNLPNCIYVNNYAFDTCSSLQSVNLPMCSSVGIYAFTKCSSLQSIDLPNCSYINMNTFTNCSSLQSVNIPMCSSVANYAFTYCSSLQSVNLPMCGSIGTYAFGSCSSLSVLDLRNTYSCSLLNSQAFSKTPFASGVGSIYVHAAHLSQFQNATNWTYFSKCFVGVGDPNRPLLSFDSGSVYGDTYYLNKNWSSYLGITISSVISIDLPNCSYVCNNACLSFKSLQTVNLPMCSYIGSSAFYTYGNKIDTVYIGTSISKVCQAGEDLFYKTVVGGYYVNKIFVPMSLVDAYKSAQYWSDYASLIFGI